MNIGKFRGLVLALALALSGCGGSSDSEHTSSLSANRAPSITLNGGASVQITVGATYSDPGASAADAEDGDLTGSIQVESTLDTDTAGTYRITYTVTDSAGTRVSVTRTVEVVAGSEPQNAAPQIALNGSDTVQVPLGETYTDAGASATDAEDGDLTSHIEISSTVDIDSVGNYTVTYSVTDSMGAAATATRAVVVFRPERTFAHPGLLHSGADFERIKSKIDGGDETWVEAWNTFTGDYAPQLGRNPAPLVELVRGGDGGNHGRVITELRFAYATALRWKISGDPAYGDLAVDYLNAWSSTLQSISGNADRFLAAGLYGYQWANVAEIMRTYDGWAEEDMEQFKGMLLNIFLPMNRHFLTVHNGACISNYWANWDLANLASIMAIGVFTDRPDIYGQALNYMYQGRGNGALENLMYYRHPGNMGQYQESGRDQGHTTLGVALYGTIAKMAWNQGDDLFAYNNYALLATSEYIARYNLLEEVPFTFYGPNCRSAVHGQAAVSDIARGNLRPAWELIYNHYQNRLGIAAPWTERMLEKTRFERYDGAGDGMGWGSLTEILDPAAVGGAPRNLYAELRGESVVLSWWGAAGADNYLLQRTASGDTAYTTIATLDASELPTHTDTDVLRGENYRYRVVAVSEAGESAPSNVIEVGVGPRLLVHYTFDDIEGNQVSSAEGETSTATLHGDPESIPGKVRNAIAFDGIDDYVSLPAGIVSKLADFSIAGWIYRDEDTNFTRLFDFGDDDQRYMYFSPRENGSSCFKITKVSYHGDRAVCAAALPSGQWVHVAITLEGSTGILYVNGEETARNEGIDLTPMQLGAATKQNWLGRSQYSADPFLAGGIDEFRIYSGALNTGEVAALAAE